MSAVKEIYIKILGFQSNIKEESKMTKMLRILTIAGWGLGTVSAGIAQPHVLHVDPAAAAGGDGSAARPFATLEQARDQIRQWHTNGTYPSVGAIVELADGDHFRTETFTLQAQDSGHRNAPVIYRAAAGATARLLGGRSFNLADFEKVEDPAIRARLPEAAREHIRQLNLRAKGITDFGELPLYGHSMQFLEPHTQWRRKIEGPELFVDEQPMTIARYPNQEFTSVGRVTDAGDTIRGWMDDVRGGPHWVPEDQRNNPARGFAFQYPDRERLQRWQLENDLRLHGYWSNNFSDQAVQVRAVDAGAGIIRTVQPSAYTVRSGQRFYAYNALCELDAPGEWYLDRESGILYLYPPENITLGRVDLSLLERPLVALENVSHVRFEGIEMLLSRADGLVVDGGDGVLIDRCRIGNLGGMGVVLQGHNHRIVNSEVFQTGRAGISLSGGNPETLIPSGMEVVNCHIHNFGRIEKTYQPAVSLAGVGHRVANNEMNAAPHTAILFTGNNHLIERNHIHDVCRETDDMAAIYAGRSWTARGTVIRHNLLRNISGYRRGTHRVSGVYLDDGLSDITVVGNVFLNVPQGIFFNGGRENRAEGNLFINVENMMRGTDLTAAFTTWAAAGWHTLNENLANSPYQSPIWREAYPRLADLLEDDPEKPKYCVVRNNLRYATPVVIGQRGIHESFRRVGWVENNPQLESRPGDYNAEQGRFVPNPESGLFELLPELRSIPFNHIGRF